LKEEAYTVHFKAGDNLMAVETRKCRMKGQINVCPDLTPGKFKVTVDGLGGWFDWEIIILHHPSKSRTGFLGKDGSE